MPLNRAEVYGANVKKPVIAAINGCCLAGGFLLALYSDIGVAFDNAYFNAYFGIPEVKRGVPPTFGFTAKTVEYYPSGIALELLLLGKTISAEQAYRFGFVNKVVRKNSLISTAEAYAEKINQLSSLVVQNIKSGFYVTCNPPRQIIALEDAIAKIVRHSKDYRGGTVAFRERRKPVWNIEKSCHQLLSMKSRIGLLYLLSIVHRL